MYMAVLLTHHAHVVPCLLLLSGVFPTTLGLKKGSCTVRRMRNGDKIRPRVETLDMCDNNMCKNFYNAAAVATSCNCACDPTNSTFSEHFGTCVPNTEIRKGCNSYMYFTGEKDASSLRSFTNTNNASERIRVPPKGQCSVSEKSSYYFRNGDWRLLVAGVQAELPFNVQLIKVKKRKSVQALQWNGQPDPSLFGHLIKLDVSCKGRNTNKAGCLIFKVQGTTHVPCDIPTAATQKSPVIPSQTPTGQRGSTPTTTNASNSTNSERTTKTSIVTDGATSEERTIPSTSSAHPTDQTNPPALRDTSNQLPVNVIIAVATAVTAVAVACVVGFIVLFCRRKKMHQNGDRTGNPIYQASNDSMLPLHRLADEPVYATVSSPTPIPPVYQPLTLERRPKDYQLLVKQPREDPLGYLEPVENTMKHSDAKEYDYACPETAIDDEGKPESPRYASADDITGYTIDGEAAHLDPTSPLYNVLEGRSPTSPAGFGYCSSAPDNASSSPHGKVHIPSEESQKHELPDNPPSSPVAYLELLPDNIA